MAIATTATTSPEPSLHLPFRPSKNWCITNRFNDPGTHHRYTPELKGHEGIDWCCNGTPIHAMAAGTVVAPPPGTDYGEQTGWNKKGDDTYVGYELTYAHLLVQVPVLIVEKTRRKGRRTGRSQCVWHSITAPILLG